MTSMMEFKALTFAEWSTVWLLNINDLVKQSVLHMELSYFTNSQNQLAFL